MKKIFTHYLATTITLLCLLFQTGIHAQTNVVLPGTFQRELGCPGDWMPDCDNTALQYNAGNGNWEGSFTIPAGIWEYKVAIDHSWTINYGVGGVQDGPNIFLDLPTTSLVTFSYNPVSHIVTTNIPPTTTSYVVLPGTFQSELGCPGDWDPACDNTGLTYDAATNKWLGTYHVETGYWEYKVAINHSWTENYGVGGTRDGANIPLLIAKPFDIAFSYDPVTHIVSTSYGCTRGVGYWKTHSAAGPATRDDTWSYIDEFTYFFWSWKSWYDVLQTPPQGNVYYMLAQQYIAARLNQLVANTTPEVDWALGEAGNFFNWYAPTSYIDKSGKPYLLNLAATLEKYNQGLIGPGACAQEFVNRRDNGAAEQGAIKVWPNPATTNFNLRISTSNKTAQVSVFDVAGRRVYTGTSNGKDLQFGQNLRAGVYVAEVVQAGKKTTLRLVKQ